MKEIVRNNLIRRGLISALSLVITISILPTYSYAYTSNDLREYLGMNKTEYVTDPPLGDQLTGLVDIDDTNHSDQQIETDLEKSETEVVITGTQQSSSLALYQDKVDRLEDLFRARLDNLSNAYLLVNTVDELIQAKEDLVRQRDLYERSRYSDGISIRLSENGNVLGTEYNPNNKSIEQKELADIYSLDYEIGAIGQFAISVVEQRNKLVTPYGYTKYNYEESYTDSKLLGVDLYAKEDDNIRSQWNGIIISIKDDYTNKFQSVTVYHGNSLYTIYSHVYIVDGIKVGSTVRSGTIIAKAANTKSVESDKENHIFYQIKIGNDFINPILIYGESGKRIYEQWLTSHDQTNVIDIGEKFFTESDLVIPEGIEDDVLPVIYPDFNSENNTPELQEYFDKINAEAENYED